MHWIKSQLSDTLKSAAIKKKQRQFLLMVIIVIILFESISYIKNDVFSNYLFYSIGMMLLCALVYLFFPKLIKWPLVIWLCLGLVLSEISSFIIFGVLYFFIFLPIRFIRGDKTNTGGWMKPAKRTTMKDQF